MLLGRLRVANFDPLSFYWHQIYSSIIVFGSWVEVSQWYESLRFPVEVTKRKFSTSIYPIPQERNGKTASFWYPLASHRFSHKTNRYFDPQRPHHTPGCFVEQHRSLHYLLRSSFAYSPYFYLDMALTWYSSLALVKVSVSLVTLMSLWSKVFCLSSKWLLLVSSACLKSQWVKMRSSKQVEVSLLADVHHHLHFTSAADD